MTTTSTVVDVQKYFEKAVNEAITEFVKAEMEKVKKKLDDNVVNIVTSLAQKVSAEYSVDRNQLMVNMRIMLPDRHFR